MSTVPVLAAAMAALLVEALPSGPAPADESGDELWVWLVAPVLVLLLP